MSGGDQRRSLRRGGGGLAGALPGGVRLGSAVSGLPSHRPLRLAALAAALALGAGCASLPRASAETAVRAQARWPGVTLAQLEQGRAVYVQRCAGCHALPLPDSRTEQQWQAVLDEMGDEAKLTSAERVLVERFILSVRTRAH